MSDRSNTTLLSTQKLSDNQERDAQAAVQLTGLLGLRRTLFLVRWIIIALLLAITLIWPVRSSQGPPLWLLIGLFALYNSLVAVLLDRLSWLHITSRLAFLDLAIVSVLYAFDTEVAGVMFTLFVVVLLSAAVIMTTRNAILVTLATIGVVAILAPLLPSWSPQYVELRLIGARLVMLALVGIGAAVLIRQLRRAYETMYSEQMEAKRLAEVERLRAEFIASISHDLNTPLTAQHAALGLLEISIADQLRPAELQLLRNARRNAEQLRQLIGDLLTYNQLRAGVFTISPEPTNLRAVVLDAVAGVGTLLQAKQQVLELELAGELPLVGDARRLEQVMMNLLGNAQKHTSERTRIVVSGRVEQSGIHLSIADNGPGIPAEAHEAIFAPYQRFNLTGGGVGLGLGIAKAIVELHDGRIWVESVVGQGTTFHITLPQHLEQLAEREV